MIAELSVVTVENGPLKVFQKLANISFDLDSTKVWDDPKSDVHSFYRGNAIGQRDVVDLGVLGRQPLDACSHAHVHIDGELYDLEYDLDNYKIVAV